MTALTVYPSSTASTTSGLTTTAKELLSAGPSSSNSLATTIAKSTGYIELRSVTATAVLTAGTVSSTVPTPSGNGWIWDATTLEGLSINAGTWTFHLQCATSVTGITSDFNVRFYKRSSGGVYTFIGMATNTAFAFPNTSIQNISASASLSAVAFTTGDRLYIDVIAKVTTNTGGSNSASITMTRNISSVSVVTPGYGPPSIASLTPSAGTTAGGTSVVIAGSGFTGVTAVTVGGVNATSFTFNTDSQITMTVPAGSVGTVDVVVTTPGGTNSNTAADDYTYAATPTVTAVSPTTFTDGDTVTVTGTNFVAGSTKVLLPGGSIDSTATANQAVVPVGSVSVASSTSLTFVASFATSTQVTGGAGDLLVNTGVVSAANRPTTLVTFNHSNFNTCEGAGTGSDIVAVGGGAWGGIYPGKTDGATTVYTTTPTMHGSRSISWTYSGFNGDGYFPCAWSDGGIPGYFRFYAYVTNMTAGGALALGCRSDSSITWYLNVDATGHLSVVDNSSGTPATGTVALSGSTWYRYEVQYNTSAAGSGTVTARVYLGDSNVILDTVTATIGTLQATQMIVLAGYGASSADHTYMDDLGTSSVTWLGSSLRTNSLVFNDRPIRRNSLLRR